MQVKRQAEKPGQKPAKPNERPNGDEKAGLAIQHSKSGDFFEWYPEVVQKAGVADYAPVRGCMVIRPYGYAIWELIQYYLDKRIKEKGHKNAYFPLFIPESFLQKEAQHFEGFMPEVAFIEKKPGDEERFALRPTSETIIYDSFSKWIRSWRDLPLLINQWANIVRWETKVTRLFLRTREFLWQEGHTAHATHGDAMLEALDILEMYRQLCEDILAVPVLAGEKTGKERFAGAEKTYTIEAVMPDGRALQMGTSHDLGQNFSKPFNIMFRDKDEKEKFVWQTSWGVSTRLIGAVMMVHGDDKGLVLPPKIAPVQAVIIPIIFESSREAVMGSARNVERQLSDFFRTELDSRDEYTAGWKFNEWEMKGVPLRIEVGPKDVEKGQIVLVRRDTGEKRFVPLGKARDEVSRTLSQVQDSLLEKARVAAARNTALVKSYNELFEMIKSRKMAKAMWCGRGACEEELSKKTGADIRLIDSKEKAFGRCVHCSQEANYVVYIAKAY